MDIVRVEPGDEQAVVGCAELFDRPPTEEWLDKFLASAGHHLLFARGEEGSPIGFVTGVELTHPDKGTEMFLYELGVHADHRNQGIGRALVGALADLARERGCYGMWVLTDENNAAALAAYGAAGAGPPEDQVMLSWTF